MIMSAHAPPSPGPPRGNAKRQRQSSSPRLETLEGAGKGGQSSGFRNVSACNRCRLRKNRCDQKLPSCVSCAKAGVACVGYDPITKREIPRSYVFYLETRVEQLEKLLASNHVSFPPAECLEPCSRQGQGTTDEDRKKPRSLASASGVSFARVVFAAVQHSVTDSESPPSSTGTSMRDSFFGLHTRPTIRPAAFPQKHVALNLVTLYFEHANPQMPILHRGEFMQMFQQAYAGHEHELGSKELYMLNMVFAIGCGVIVEESMGTEAGLSQDKDPCRPEEYHASAIVHLEACLSNSGGGLEVLQAVLLHANFALLRPVPPGLWYIVGVAVRLAVDLGLHYEEGADGESPVSDADLGGRRLWIRDLRRRLWWCTYSFDRLVSTCVGRPFGISDQVITTELPSLLSDEYITPQGFLARPGGEQPSYKHVAHHYFRLRMLQSEILQVLQYNQAQLTKVQGRAPCPYLAPFDSFRSWRMDIDARLWRWKTSAPTRAQTGVAFSTEFLELNYWQAIILLYRQSLSIPAVFEGEYNTSKEVNSPTGFIRELREDEEGVYVKVAEAGQRILRLYRQLHLGGLVSYTYLSTHHLFTAGISYLYAIWHSAVVRSRLTMDEVDFTILAAKSVLTDLIDKCPPAETCRDAFDRTAKATIKMALSSGGFGQATSWTEASLAKAVFDGGEGWVNDVQDQSFGFGLGWEEHDTNPFDTFFFGGQAI